jgi:L-iditol 2-dehydrogenase
VDYDYLGSRSDGAFAEYVCASVWNVLPVPDNVSFEEAAMTEPAAVALHALGLSNMKTGDTVLIFGAGPIGLLTGLWAGQVGAGRVLIADIDDARLAFAREQGFKHAFNCSENGDCTKRAPRKRGETGLSPFSQILSLIPHGADVVIEGSGASAAFEQAMHGARPCGTVVLLGNPAGEMHLSQKGYWHILRKELTLKGAWNSVYRGSPKDEWQSVLEAMASGRLTVRPLITHRVPLSRLPDTLLMMRDRREFFSKVLVIQ